MRHRSQRVGQVNELPSTDALTTSIAALQLQVLRVTRALNEETDMATQALLLAKRCELESVVAFLLSLLVTAAAPRLRLVPASQESAG